MWGALWLNHLLQEPDGWIQYWKRQLLCVHWCLILPFATVVFSHRFLRKPCCPAHLLSARMWRQRRICARRRRSWKSRLQMLQMCRMEAIHQPPKRMQESWGDITVWSFWHSQENSSINGGYIVFLIFDLFNSDSRRDFEEPLRPSQALFRRCASGSATSEAWPADQGLQAAWDGNSRSGS